MVYLSFPSVFLLLVCCGGIGWRSTVAVDASGDASLSLWRRHPNKLWQPQPLQVRRSRQRWVATVTQDCSIPRRRMLLRRHGCQEKQKPNEGSSFAMENVDACPSLTISATVGPQKSMLSSSLSSSLISSVCSLRGGGPPDGEVSALVDDAYAWCMNLGQPSALIAGAVIATIYENIGNGDLDILPQDSPFTKFKKRLTSSLLISAFGLEIIAIFVTTVTGTMLLSRPLHDMDHVVPVGPHTTPLAFLRENFEFEYLTARVAYLQGLLNWLAAIAVGHIIPRSGESKETKQMNRFISSALFCTIALMMAFYNKHMSFYKNYYEMLEHWVTVIARRFFFCWPPRVMGIVYIPAVLSTVYWGYRGCLTSSHHRTPKQKTPPPEVDEEGSPERKKNIKGGKFI